MEGVSKFEVFAPRAVLMDFHMPRMDGGKAAKLIRERHPEARILLCSGFESGGRAQECSEGLGLPYLPKPFDLAGLARALRALLAG
jgi:two-component system chemotaxis response regulator CheY